MRWRDVNGVDWQVMNGSRDDDLVLGAYIYYYYYISMAWRGMDDLPCVFSFFFIHLNAV